LDMLGPAVLIGQILGRWGNFTNAEAFGGITDLPWRMGINNVHYPETIYVHPTFLYESLWNLVGFLLINWFYTKKKYNGQIILMYVTWYGLGRMFIEGLRSDSLYIGAFKVSQLVGLISFVGGTILLIVLGIKNKNNKKEVV
jgi:Prolipoprotein diacylglyceryltransferase